MGKQKAQVILIKSEENSDDVKADAKSEEPSEDDLSEEPSEDDLSEEPSEGPREEPSEEPSEEEDPSEESMSHPSSDGDNDDNEQQSALAQLSSGEKRKSVDTTENWDDASQEVCLRKKFKQEQSLDTKPDDHFRNNLSSKSVVDDSNASDGQENTGSSGKRRRSRWESLPDSDGKAVDSDRDSKRRKARWAVDESQLKMLGPIQLPDFVKDLVTGMDPEIQKLNTRLIEINRKLQGSVVVDDRAEKERSPSPPPVYNNLGIKINLREVRFREKLIQERQEIISSLITNNSTFKQPSDYKSPKYQKKLYIPLKEYPGYNFIGLIIGPCGNTQKRMEKETGAKILLRGKGSSCKKTDVVDNDDLHVLVEADSQKSLDAAVGLVEKLLVPVEEGTNEHKRAQLRELAELKGSITCRACGEQGHVQQMCPSKPSCQVCGKDSHPTALCPLTASTPSNHSFLADLGGAAFGTSPIPSGAIPLGAPSYASHSFPGQPTTATNHKPNREIDNANLFVGYLPHSVDDNRLVELFSPFGRLVSAKVIRDREKGISKGYGFVKFIEAVDAAKAVANMSGYKIEGKMLAVRVAGLPPPVPIPGPMPVGPAGIFTLPKYVPPPALITQGSPGPHAWPGPPGSMISEPSPSISRSHDLGLPPSAPLGHLDSFSSQMPSLPYGSMYQVPIASSPVTFATMPPSALAQFPGNLSNPSSQYHSYHGSATSSQSSQFPSTHSLGSSHTPPLASVFPHGQDEKVKESKYDSLLSKISW